MALGGVTGLEWYELGTGLLQVHGVVSENGLVEERYRRVRCEVGKPTGFRRGDANPQPDGIVNLSDGIVILNFLFLEGEAPGCFDAADVDDNGGVRLNDPVFLFNYLFLGGDSPPLPGPLGCGDDPTDDSLECVASCP